MPRSKTKLLCPVCDTELSASVLVVHIRSRHCDDFERLRQESRQFYDKNRAVCPCGNIIPEQANAFNIWLAARLSGDESRALRKICSRACRGLLGVWNAGLTKATNSSLAKMACERTGEQNPIHAVKNDPARRELWVKHLIEADAAQHTRGKSLAEIHGVERAAEVSQRMSKSASEREVHGHTGHKHTEATKRAIGLKTIAQLQRRGNITSAPQRRFYDALVTKLGIERVMLETRVGWYSVDITVDGRVAVEVDGDFFHVNEARGFSARYACQKKNIMNDAKKNAFLASRGWKVVRVWVSDIDASLDAAVERIVHEVDDGL